jgi:hypothetical protein
MFSHTISLGAYRICMYHTSIICICQPPHPFLVAFHFCVLLSFLCVSSPLCTIYKSFFLPTNHDRSLPLNRNQRFNRPSGLTALHLGSTVLLGPSVSTIPLGPTVSAIFCVPTAWDQLVCMGVVWHVGSCFSASFDVSRCL